jgi:hypothetical protein
VRAAVAIVVTTAFVISFSSSLLWQQGEM